MVFDARVKLVYHMVSEARGSEKFVYDMLSKKNRETGLLHGI